MFLGPSGPKRSAHAALGTLQSRAFREPKYIRSRCYIVTRCTNMVSVHYFLPLAISAKMLINKVASGNIGMRKRRFKIPFKHAQLPLERKKKDLK